MNIARMRGLAYYIDACFTNLRVRGYEATNGSRRGYDHRHVGSTERKSLEVSEAKSSNCHVEVDSHWNDDVS